MSIAEEERNIKIENVDIDSPKEQLVDSFNQVSVSSQLKCLWKRYRVKQAHSHQSTLKLIGDKTHFSSHYIRTTLFSYDCITDTYWKPRQINSSIVGSRLDSWFSKYLWSLFLYFYVFYITDISQ